METIAEFKNYRWSRHGKLYRQDFICQNSPLIGSRISSLKSFTEEEWGMERFHLIIKHMLQEERPKAIRKFSRTLTSGIHGQVRLDSDRPDSPQVLQEYFRPAETEAWDLEEKSMNLITPNLSSFESGIALYVVDANFCKK